jgi:fructuronate reductase
MSQDGLYSLVERSTNDDSIVVVGSLSEVWDGARVDVFEEIVARPTTAIVTMTVTETGYGLLPDGALDLSNRAMAHDVEILADRAKGRGIGEHPASPLARLVCALQARREAGSGPISIVPCDNMPDNGAMVGRGVEALAAILDPTLLPWITSNVSFVSTSVDRITPRTTERDLETVREMTGWDDSAAVVAEPFSDWVLAGDFPAGRPNWETAGARFVDDVAPYERRKLWLLNGAHSILAFAGIGRGHATIADAIRDPQCRSWVDQFWDEASRHLPAFLEVDAYRDVLVGRFENHRIRHELAQVALEGTSKLRYRIAPVALAELEAGRPAAACAIAIASWIGLVLSGQRLGDAFETTIASVLARDPAEVVRLLVDLVDPRLALDEKFVATVELAVRGFTAGDSESV